MLRHRSAVSRARGRQARLSTLLVFSALALAACGDDAPEKKAPGPEPEPEPGLCEAGTWDDDDDESTPCVPEPGPGPKPNPEPTLCETGTWDDDNDAATPCVAVPVCEAGTWDDDGLPGTPCVAICEAGFWDADGNPETPCEPHALCEAGSFPSAPGNVLADVTCSPCEIGQYCVGGAVMPVACEPGSWDDDQNPATPCVTHADCGVGEQIAAAGTASSNRLCEACPSGTFSTGPNQAQCQPHGACVAGTQLATPGTSTSDNACSACTAGQHCAGGTSAAETCGAEMFDDDNHPATPCIAKTNCLAGSRVVSQGSTTENRSCAPCDDGFYSTSPNAASCTAQTACEPGTYASTPGSKSANRACSPCEEDTYSTSANALACTEQPVCDKGEITPGTSTTPRVCLGKPIAVEAGSVTTCAIHEGGYVTCWGGNFGAIIGSSDTYVTKPQRLDLTYEGKRLVVDELAVQSNFACARAEGKVYCWGSNEHGQLGTGTNASVTGIRLVYATNPVKALAAGSENVCVIETVASESREYLVCWGRRTHLRMPSGASTETQIAAPERAGYYHSQPYSFSYLTRGLETGCVVANGELRCWGQLPGGIVATTTNYGRPVGVSLITDYSPVTAAAAATGHDHICVLKTSGLVACWGSSDYYQTSSSTGPNANIPNFTGVTAIAAGYRNTCALRDSKAYCWGYHRYDSPLGDGVADLNSLYDLYTPTPVVGIEGDAVSLSMGMSHACVLNSESDIYCWGVNSAGQLGDGTRTTGNVAVRVSF